MGNKEIEQQDLLRNILNGMEALITVCDAETFEILFINDALRKNFSIEGDGVGQLCYKLLQGLDRPCPECPYQQLRKEPDKTLIWEHQERIKGDILRKTARFIDWTNGKRAHLEYAIDITELRKTQETVIRLESEAEKIYYDPLTGLYNRRYFNENMERLLCTLSRSDGTLSLMMVDIDYFKNYNDTYGHIKGDDCLRSIADILKNNIIRRDDFVARYGGEEFVIVLPNTDRSGARVIAERVIANVWNRNILHVQDGEEKRVSISIGVTTGEVKYTSTVEDFIRRADDMLYESKRNGRNKYTFANL